MVYKLKSSFEFTFEINPLIDYIHSLINCSDLSIHFIPRKGHVKHHCVFQNYLIFLYQVLVHLELVGGKNSDFNLKKNYFNFL